MKSKLLMPVLIAIMLSGGKMKSQMFTNWDFESSTPTPNVFNCSQTPYGWSASSSPSAVQWENRWNSSWWIDLTDCGWGNGRWLEQTVATTPGQKYLLKFDLGASQWFDAGLDLYIDGNLVQHYEEPNDGVTGLRWNTFGYCLTAANNTTTFRFACNSIGYAPVVGFDNAWLEEWTPSLSWVVSSPCVPAMLARVSPPPVGFGTSNWYRNGTLINSGNDTIYASLPGNYKLVYITGCGDTLTKDTVIIDCDTCAKMTAKYFCSNDSTVFTFDPDDDCVRDNCIGHIHIDYGDGQSYDSNAGPARFVHQYSPGSYTVIYCWEEICKGQTTTKCDTLYINIEDCNECWVTADFSYTGCNPVHFTNTTLSNYHILSSTWDFGDGNSSTALNPIHSYSSPGTNMVCLTVVTAGPNNTECSGTICFYITVVDCDSDGGGSNGRSSAPGRVFDLSKGIDEMYYPGVSVFPNPTNGDIDIKGIPSDNSTLTIRVYDVSGRLLHTETVSRNVSNVTLPVKNLDPGTYFVKVTGSNFTKEMKFIKQ